MKRIIFITENVNKFKEIVSYLEVNEELYGGKIAVDMYKPNYELHEIQSLNRTEIVMQKLNDALITQSTISSTLSNDIETWLMVEDTSLSIVKQGGFPGPFIKYYLQSLPITAIANNNWGSESQSYVNLAIGQVTQHVCWNNNLDNEIATNTFTVTKSFEGTINGFICEPRGTNGFGFDPIFLPTGSQKTNAEMNMEEKAMFNPRTQAFQMVLDYLFL